MGLLASSSGDVCLCDCVYVPFSIKLDFPTGKSVIMHTNINIKFTEFSLNWPTGLFWPSGCDVHVHIYMSPRGIF